MGHNVDRDELHGKEDMPETILSLGVIKRSIEEKLPLPPLEEILPSLNKNLIFVPKDPKPEESDFEQIHADDIFLVVARGDLENLKKFISKYGSNRVLNLKLRNDFSILHEASLRGQWNICEYLVSKLKFNVNMKDIQGNTPLHHTILGGDPRFNKFRAPIIIGGSEDLSRLVNVGDQMKTIDVLAKVHADMNAFNLEEHSALHLAARLGNIDAIKRLLKHGCATMLIPTADFGTPVRSAAGRDTEDALVYLLKNNADPNIVPDGCLSPLLVALLRHRKKCAIRLILAGANANYTAHRMTPLELATSLGSMEIVDCLLDKGAQPNCKDICGLTPLELAAMENNRGMVEKLFNKTSRIEGIEDWSVDGVIRYCCSQEFETKYCQREEDALSYYLSEGESAFKARKYISAMMWFSQARSINKDNEFYFAKKCLCYSMMKDMNNAWQDACHCTKLNPKYPLGCYAKGVALNVFKQFYMAATYFEKARQYDPGNKVYEDAFRDAIKDFISSHE